MIREENKHCGHKMKLVWFMGYEQELKTPHNPSRENLWPLRGMWFRLGTFYTHVIGFMALTMLGEEMKGYILSGKQQDHNLLVDNT